MGKGAGRKEGEKRETKGKETGGCRKEWGVASRGDHRPWSCRVDAAFKLHAGLHSHSGR